MTYFRLYSTSITLHHKKHWIKLYEKQTKGNKLYLFLDQKDRLTLATVLTM